MRDKRIAAQTWLLLLGLLLAWTPPGASTAETNAYEGMQVERPKRQVPAPDFTLPRLQSGSITLAALRGKVVLLNFWATFCAPCRKEMPALSALWREYRQQGLIVIGINGDRGSLRVVERFIEETGQDFPIVLDTDGAVRNRYEVYALPTTYLVGRDGRIWGRIVGERDWRSPAAHDLIRHLLQSPR